MQEGRIRLSKLNFLAKFPIGLPGGLHTILQKFKTVLNQMCKNYFNQKFIGVQPRSPLEIILNGLYF